MLKTSVIGLGAMGAGIAGNLHHAGLLSGAWNRTEARGLAVAQCHGFDLAKDMRNAVEHAELIITSVSADEDLLEVATQLAQVLEPSSIILDTSTVSVDTAIQVSAILREKDIHFLDGPVSGGKEGAENGTLVMMVGGEEAVLKKVTTTLSAISKKASYMGEVGTGQATKAVNQVMCAGINQAVTEALAFAQHQGLDSTKVIDTLSDGAAGNWFLEHRGQSMCDGSFNAGFRVKLHQKDLKICQQMLASEDIHLPMIEMTLVHYQRLIDSGFGDEDISALFRQKLPLFD